MAKNRDSRKKIALQKYDPHANKIFSIPDRELKNEIRQNLNGGICCVHHRAVVLNSEDRRIPKSAREAPNGKIFKKLLQGMFFLIFV
jgi:hypothetical protein